MPPKKKQRKTKKQIEQELKEHQEQLRILEEQERERKEKEEKIRIEEEKRLKEVEEKRVAEERKRLVEEEDKLAYWHDNYKDQKKSLYASLKEREEWEKFLKCETLPDPNEEREITAHITKWMEEKDTTVEKCIQNCQTGEEIVKLITEKLAEAQAVDNNLKARWCYDYITKLRECIRFKLDEFTCYILEHVEQYLIMTEEEVKALKDKRGGGLQSKVNKDHPNTREFNFLKSLREDVKLGVYINSTEKSYKMKPIDFQEINIHCQLPRNNMSNIIMRASWTSYNDITVDSYLPYMIVGGIVNIELFNFPLKSKLAKNWTIRPILDMENTLKQINYPDATSLAAQNINPLQVHYNLPDYVYFLETDPLKVAFWDSRMKQWNTEGIDELSLDRSTKLITFQTMRLAPMAFIMSRCSDYPYKSWKLRSIEPKVAILDIVGKRCPYVFQIGPGYVKLIENQAKELAHIVDAEFAPGMMLHALYKCGVNLMPIENDAEYCDEFTLKDSEVEERAILDVVTSVDAFAFRSSKWNQKLGKERIGFKLRENFEYDREFFEDYEMDWTYCSWYYNKCGLIKMKDDAENCNSDFLEGHETHSQLHLALKAMCSEEAFQKCAFVTHIYFAETLKKFLRLLRLFSFT